MLQCDKEAFENVDYGGGIVHLIKKQYPDLVVSDQSAGEDYYALLHNIKKIFRIFFVGMIIVYGIWKGNVITNTLITVEWEYLIGIVMYLFGVSFVLYPTVRKM